jgi:hypothetical protein
MSFINNKKNSGGVGLVEVVIGASIVVLIFSGIVSVFNFYYRHSVNLTDNIKAEFLLEEGLEALRTIRDENFNHLKVLSPETSHWLFFTGTKWQATSSPVLIDSIYDRSFTTSPVYRDAGGALSSAGELDEDMLLVSVSISWSENTATTTRIISTYLANVFEN